ncbi:MAG: alpha/beta fold hydrolase [Myxococcales bacterium FL481]|nr:MAG: alpha/beta fold hydrolase [Myxococcales bacterium FL481]
MSTESPSLTLFTALASLAVVGAGCPTADPGAESPAPGASDEPTPATTPESESPELQTIQIPAEGVDLEGVLHLPVGQEPVPAILLVHGSGPASRDQPTPGQLNMAFGFTIPVFAQLAAALTQRGFAVLRYDKRSCGRFNGLCDNDYPPPPDDLTIDAFIDDARRAVEFLAAHPRVDADRVFVVGHSQGATLLPTLLSHSSTARAGVMIAGNFDPIDRLVANQLAATQHLLAGQGLTPEQIDAIPAVASLTEMAQQLAALRAGTHDGTPIGGAPAAFWRSYFDQHERAIAQAAQLDRPLLALRGSYDWNIDSNQWEKWRNTLQASPHAGLHDAVELPCVTHALNCVSEPDWHKIKPEDIGREVSETVVEAIVGFLAT